MRRRKPKSQGLGGDGEDLVDPDPHLMLMGPVGKMMMKITQPRQEEITGDLRPHLLSLFMSSVPATKCLRWGSITLPIFVFGGDIKLICTYSKIGAVPPAAASRC